jgi:hypothetical protein
MSMPGIRQTATPQHAAASPIVPASTTTLPVVSPAGPAIASASGGIEEGDQVAGSAGDLDAPLDALSNPMTTSNV